MVARCSNPNDQSYSNYGARGIRVHPDWLADPRPFIAWVRANLGPAPSSAHTIDRIDNNRGYEPGNLQWATKSWQTINQRKARSNTGIRGIHRTKNGTFRATLYRRNMAIYLGTFPSLDEAADALANARKEYDMKHYKEAR